MILSFKYKLEVFRIWFAVQQAKGLAFRRLVMGVRLWFSFINYVLFGKDTGWLGSVSKIEAPTVTWNNPCSQWNCIPFPAQAPLCLASCVVSD